jgi:hypothetical protein
MQYEHTHLFHLVVLHPIIGEPSLVLPMPTQIAPRRARVYRTHNLQCVHICHIPAHGFGVDGGDVGAVGAGGFVGDAVEGFDVVISFL